MTSLQFSYHYPTVMQCLKELGLPSTKWLHVGLPSTKWRHALVSCKGPGVSFLTS